MMALSKNADILSQFCFVQRISPELNRTREMIACPVFGKDCGTNIRLRQSGFEKKLSVKAGEPCTPEKKTCEVSEPSQVLS
ncbi:MAG: hypothetical protein BWK80_43750 [Desulfobacteraceae bacterium IS3]|nr:MAG: hypothetical protein BWK80_43750 [Desulfobacteraceae bacterium IS3]